jgi:hypothetical protein
MSGTLPVLAITAVAALVFVACQKKPGEPMTVAETTEIIPSPGAIAG